MKRFYPHGKGSRARKIKMGIKKVRGNAENYLVHPHMVSPFSHSPFVPRAQIYYQGLPPVSSLAVLPPPARAENLLPQYESSLSSASSMSLGPQDAAEVLPPQPDEVIPPKVHSPSSASTISYELEISPEENKPTITFVSLKKNNSTAKKPVLTDEERKKRRKEVVNKAVNKYNAKKRAEKQAERRRLLEQSAAEALVGMAESSQKGGYIYSKTRKSRSKSRSRRSRRRSYD